MNEFQKELALAVQGLTPEDVQKVMIYVHALKCKDTESIERIENEMAGGKMV